MKAFLRRNLSRHLNEMRVQAMGEKPCRPKQQQMQRPWVGGCLSEKQYSHRLLCLEWREQEKEQQEMKLER